VQGNYMMKTKKEKKKRRKEGEGMGDLGRVNQLNKIAVEIIDHIENTILKKIHLAINGKDIEERYIRAMVAKNLFSSIICGRLMGKSVVHSVADAERLFDRAISDIKSRL